MQAHWKDVYQLAFRLVMDPVEARSIVRETYLRAQVGRQKLPEDAERQRRWLLRIAATVSESRMEEETAVSFDLLDDTLRTEETRTDVVRSLTNPQRNYFLWELKQGCMTSVINCLPAGERIAFALSVILGLTEAEGAETLGIRTSAYKVRLSRARQKVADYLAPRCEHVNPANPCRCPSRLGVALEAGFLPAPGSVVQLRPRPEFGRYGSSVDGEDAPLRDVMKVYQSLPDPDMPADLPEQILEALRASPA